MLAHIIVALSLVIPPAVVAAPVGPVVRMSMAAPATDVQVYASVKVDAAGFGQVGSAIATRVQQQAETTLVAEGVIKRAKVDDLNVFIKVTPPDNGDEGYVLGVAVERLGKPILEVSQDKCELCVEDELIELVAKKMQELAPKMREHMAALAAVPPEPEPEPEPEPVPVPVDTTPPPVTDDDTPQGLSGSGKAGLAFLAVGAVGAGVGLGLAVRKPTQKSPEVGYEFIDTRRPGYAVLAVGAAMLVTGAVLFGIDARKRKRREAPDATVAPVVGPTSAGLFVSGKF